MNSKDLKMLCETAMDYAEWAEDNIWEVPITLPDVLKQMVAEIKSGQFKERVYGCSDDLVSYNENEVDCFEKDVKITFTDGTQIRVGYPKKRNRCVVDRSFEIWHCEIQTDFLRGRVC